MSKADKIDALLESAILTFAKDGYAGASLREIASRANIVLSTIHMYFGSKVELYQEAHRKVWVRFSNERNGLIQDARKDGPDQLLNLDDFIRALALPIVRRALSNKETDIAELMLLRSMVAEQEHFEADAAPGHSLVYWVDTFAEVCPELSRKDLVLAYSFILSVIWHWRSADRRYDDLLCEDLNPDLNEVVEDIVSFASAGVSAMIERRNPILS